MNSLALTIVLLLWLPPLVVVLYNLFWDIRFWQVKDYRFDRMFQHLRWDFELTHRKPVYVYVKLGLFALLVTFAIFPGSFTALLAVIIAFAIWLNEVFTIGERLLRHRFPYLDVTLRNLSMLIIGIVFMGIPPLILTLYLLSINPPDLGLAAGVGLVPSVTSGGTELIPLTFIYLVFSTMLALVYDLGSPVITFFLVLVTSPFAWLEKQFYLFVAKLFMLRMPNLVTIAVTGSYSKTTTREILTYLLKSQFKVAVTDFTETSPQRLALSIISGLKPSAQIFIAELNAYKPGDMASMTRLLNPQVAILTGIDQSHIGIFGSMERTLETKSEVVKWLQPRSTVIYNGDDELLHPIAGQYDNKEVFYFNKANTSKDLTGNRLEVDDYYVTDVKLEGKKLQFVLHNQTREVELVAPAAAQKIMTSLIGAIAAAIEAGLSFEHVVSAVRKLPIHLLEPELIAGDNTTLLINEPRPLSVKGLTNLLHELKHTHATQHVVVTSGITELGKHKHAAYAALADQIVDAADTLITYDKHLLRAVHKNNSKLETIYVNHIDELIYQVRAQTKSGAAILLAGPLDPSIVAAVRDE